MNALCETELELIGNPHNIGAGQRVRYKPTPGSESYRVGMVMEVGADTPIVRVWDFAWDGDICVGMADVLPSTAPMPLAPKSEKRGRVRLTPDERKYRERIRCRNFQRLRGVARRWLGLTDREFRELPPASRREAYKACRA